MSARLVLATDLTLLIQSPESGQATINPDPQAMLEALQKLVLNTALMLYKNSFSLRVDGG